MISIIIPTYNRAYIIGRTIDSILNQKYTSWECIIVDDYSSDSTESVILEYQRKDDRIKFLRNKRSKGAQGARNTGILAAEGEWVVLFDSDNIMKPDFLYQCIQALEDKGCDVVNTWSSIIDVNDDRVVGTFKWINNGYIHDGLMTRKCYVDNSSTIIRKTLLLKIGLLAEDCPAFQEWDTHIRLSEIAIYYTIKEYLIDYYTGAEDAISSSNSKDIRGYIYILNKFKREWIKNHLFYFIKLSAILKNKIIATNNPSLYLNSYNDLVGTHKILSDVVAFIMRYKNI